MMREVSGRMRTGMNGAPLIVEDGTVAGMMVAVATDDPNRAYALAAEEDRFPAAADGESDDEIKSFGNEEVKQLVRRSLHISKGPEREHDGSHQPDGR
ncbi:hypothetical protein ACQEVF_21330 [Nonomuraea polychroma]|uniref:hypothetical protein n=1 Tax=Nonomuraea polychroma TaxID=46176 RepID=UPI003D8FA431